MSPEAFLQKSERVAQAADVLKAMASDFADVCTGVEALLFGLRSKLELGLTPEELAMLFRQLERLVDQENIEFLTTAVKAQVEESLRQFGLDGEGDSVAA